MLPDFSNINAEASTDNAVTVGEIYKDSGFDPDNVALMFKYLTGNDGARLSDVANMVNGGVVDAQTLRNNVNKTGSGQKDIIVRIGGYDWTVVFLSTVDQAGADDNADNGDVVATFWLADSSVVQTASYSAHLNTVAGSYPSAMYGTSQMRAVVLNNGGAYATDNHTLSSPVPQDVNNEWAQFTMPEIDGKENFLATCIISPSCLNWQETEAQKNYGTYGTTNFNNEAYAKNITDMPANDMQGFEGYDAWKDDKLWLPSVTELGLNTAIAKIEGVWKTSAEQKKSASSYRALTRSGNSANNTHVTVITADGTLNISGTPAVNTQSSIIRPAFHLNLNKIFGVSQPQPVTKTYKGLAYTLNEITDGCGWYRSNKMNLEVVDGNLKDVGAHKIKVTLSDENLIFAGTPGEGESDTVRFFTLTINPKTVTVPNVADAVQTYDPVNGNRFAVTGYDGTAVTVTGLALNNNAFEITSAGTYTVTFVLKDKNNYEWSGGGTGDKTVTLTVNRISLTIPTLNTTSLPYDKNGSEFDVSDYDGSTMTASGVTDGISWNGTAFEALDAGDYAVKFALNNKTDYEWSDGGTDDIEVTVKITPKPVQVKWTAQKTEITDTDPSFFIMLPALDVTAEVKALLTDVRYYLKEDCTVNGSNVTVSGNPVLKIEKDKSYYAVVQINTALAKNNYSFSGNLFSAFDTKDGRTVVSVTLENSEVTYDGTPKPATAIVVTVDGDTVTDIDLQYTYYAEGVADGTADAPTDAGKYRLVISIKPASSDKYTTADSLEFNYLINQAEPVLDPFCKTEGLFAGGDLPALSAGADSTAGSYVWDNPDGKLLVGTRLYGYTFTPDNPNYKTVKSAVSLSAAEAGIKSISAQFDFPETNEDGSEFTVYDSWSPEKLREWLTVTGTKEDGTAQDNLQGYVITTPRLTAGENVIITITYGNAPPCNATIPKVVKCELVEITAFCTPGKPVYTSTNINTLKQWLTVTGKNNDGTDYSGEIRGADCTLSFGEDGKLTAGTISVTLTYGGLTTSFSVTVTEVALAGISAVWDPTSVDVDKITADTPEEKLRELIQVSGVNNDGSSYGEITGYTLDAVPEGTVLTVYISFNGFNAELTKEIEKVPEPVVKKQLPLPDTDVERSYTGSDINILDEIFADYKKYVEWGESDDITAKVAGNYSVTLTIKDEYTENYEWADTEGNSVTIKWNIIPAEISGSWNDKGTLNLESNSYKGAFDNVFKYTYYDEKDNVVTELVEGQTYKVVAELADTKNFVLTKEISALLTVPYEFTVKISEPSVADNAVQFIKNNLAIVIGVGVGLLLLIVLIIFLACRRKRADDYYDDDYDYDDEADDDYGYDDEDY